MGTLDPVTFMGSVVIDAGPTDDLTWTPGWFDYKSDQMIDFLVSLDSGRVFIDSNFI